MRINKKLRREFARMESQRFMGEPVVEPGRPLWTIGRNVPGRMAWPAHVEQDTAVSFIVTSEPEGWRNMPSTMEARRMGARESYIATLKHLRTPVIVRDIAIFERLLERKVGNSETQWMLSEMKRELETRTLRCPHCGLSSEPERWRG